MKLTKIQKSKINKVRDDISNEIKYEWEFHKRHPELLLIWAGVAWVIYTLAKIISFGEAQG